MHDLIEIAEAERILAEATTALDVVETVIDAALGHVLAETIHADRDFPPTDRSMMDGFAVRTADLTSDGQRLRITGEVRAVRALDADGRQTERLELWDSVTVQADYAVPRPIAGMRLKINRPLSIVRQLIAVVVASRRRISRRNSTAGSHYDTIPDTDLSLDP